ncbi:MAG: hypothetical protein NDJ92_01995 [Thermoanaerobaculia bacterium]|nr:hypothetical protein [Thermoanaerobaculia bacterium]
MNRPRLGECVLWVIASPLLLAAWAWRFWTRDRAFLAALRRGTVRCADCHTETKIQGVVSTCSVCHFTGDNLAICFRCLTRFAIECSGCRRTLEVR